MADKKPRGIREDRHGVFGEVAAVVIGTFEPEAGFKLSDRVDSRHSFISSLGLRFLSMSSAFPDRRTKPISTDRTGAPWSGIAA